MPQATRVTVEQIYQFTTCDYKQSLLNPCACYCFYLNIYKPSKQKVSTTYMKNVAKKKPLTKVEKIVFHTVKHLLL